MPCSSFAKCHPMYRNCFYCTTKRTSACTSQHLHDLFFNSSRQSVSKGASVCSDIVYSFFFSNSFAISLSYSGYKSFCSFFNYCFVVVELYSPRPHFVTNFHCAYGTVLIKNDRYLIFFSCNW